MKAVVLAGGSGTRGRPYTEYIPKAMIPVCGRPAIAHIVDYLGRSDAIDGITVLADLEGLGGQIQNYLGGSGRDISFVQDSGSGTGGDLLHLAPDVCEGGQFLLWFADNLCRIDVAGMRDRLRESRTMACIATRTRRREGTGFAVVDGGLIKRFVEKPEVQLPMSECLGVYVLSAGIINEIRRCGSGQVNLSYDILEGLSGRGQVSAFDIGQSPWIDVESPAILDRNMPVVKKIIRQMGGPSPSRTQRSPRRA